MRVGVLTGGGDCPGLNAVIRAVVRKGEVEHGDSFVGFRDGWKGLTENLTRQLDVEHCRGILPKNAFGTMVGLKADVIDLVPLGEAVSEVKTVGPGLLDDAALFC